MLAPLYGGVGVANASSVTVDFKIQNIATEVFALDLTVTSDDTVGGVISFAFENVSDGVAAGSSVHNVYFESGLSSHLGAFSVNEHGVATAGTVAMKGGIGYKSTNAPPSMESAGTLNIPGMPAWTTNYARYDKDGAAANGINVNDIWTMSFIALTDITADGLIGLITDVFDETSRIAVHVGDCGGDDISCTAVAWPPNPVPVPAALPLFLSGLIGLGVMARRKRKSAAA